MNATNHAARVIRGLREQRQWTLDHAAARLGVSRRLIAQIEAGTANPSLSTLLTIAEGFGVHLTDLFDTPAQPDHIQVQENPDAAPALWATKNGSSAQLLLGRGALELWHWSLEPGDFRSSAAHGADSAETLYVTSGTIELRAGEDKARLFQGGSAILNSGVAHEYRNPGSDTAKFVLTVFDPAATTT